VIRSWPDSKEFRLTGPNLPWSTLPATGVHEILRTLRTAIGAAQRYVYVEDQAFDAENTLFPGLVAACRRGVKVIALLPGWVDPNDGTNAPANRQLSATVRRGLIDRLTAPHDGNLAIWRLRNVTVHAKVILIDDEFLCVGSANAMDRSLEYTQLGDDSELSVAAVSAGALVADLRVRLWAEHLRVGTAAALAEIRDLGRSLGIWRPSWGSGLTVPRPASPLTFVGPAGSSVPQQAPRLFRDSDRSPGTVSDQPSRSRSTSARTRFRLSPAESPPDQAGNPLSERRLAQMFGRTSRRWARARIADARHASLLPDSPSSPVTA
jgi:hypothetical protein